MTSKLYSRRYHSTERRSHSQQIFVNTIFVVKIYILFGHGDYCFRMIKRAEIESKSVYVCKGRAVSVRKASIMIHSNEPLKLITQEEEIVCWRERDAYTLFTSTSRCSAVVFVIDI